jgi:multidrug efflux pump
VNLPQFCIKRPVFTIALSLVLVIVGIISFSRLSVREYPRMDKPIISIRTVYSGASADLMENDVTTPIENAVASVNGIEAIRSKSSEGRSNINIEFGDDYNINVGMNDVRDKLSGVIRHLPNGIEAPILHKNDSDSRPAIVVAVIDEKKNALQLTDYINRYVEPLVQQVDGVSNVWLWGARPYAMRVWLNPLKMAARNVTVKDMVDSLQAQNINVPAGEIKGPNRDYPVVANAGLQSPQQFNDLIVRDTAGKITRFKDVAQVKVGSAQMDSAFRVEGKSGIALGIVPDSTANPIDVSQGVRKAIKQLSSSLPPGMQLKVVFDSASFINLSIHEVYSALIEALILVILVVFLFLGSLRSTLIPVVTIPVCLVSIFAGLYFFNYSINTITLLALVLAIGLVVDDAIVMLENIYRYVESGMSPYDAAMKGSKEIVFAIIAMTLTLVAVYLPIAFTQGLTGTLFRQFALTLAGAVTISGFVALTLSPMMSARLLRPVDHGSRYHQWLDKFMERLMNGYRRTLQAALAHRPWVVVALIALALLGWWFYRGMPTELAPTEDRGSIMGIVNAPTNASFQYTDRYAKKIEAVYASIPEAHSSLMSVGYPNANSAFSILSLKPWDKRERSQKQIATQLRKDFAKIPGVKAFPVSPAPFSRGGSSNHSVEMRIMTSSSYKNLESMVGNLVGLLGKAPMLTNVDSSIKMDNQQFNVEINRSLAADLQVNLNDISTTIATLLGGKTESTFEFDGQNYDVMLQMQRKDLKDLTGLDKIYVRNAVGQMISLSTLVKITPVVGTVMLPHYDRLRSDDITAELAPGYTMGQAVAYLQKFMDTHLPANAKFQFSGAVKDYLDSHSRMASIFLLALAFIYLVLAAQFESFVDPFIVLLSVPLSLVGGLVVLRFAGGTINIYSEIALVTLIGLIAKHGILITEFANQLRTQGKNALEAVTEAATLRLRPILMTTGAMVLGALPLALAHGPGAVSRQQVGWVIVGGMLFGTFFSLFVVPTAYVYLTRRK